MKQLPSQETLRGLFSYQDGLLVARFDAPRGRRAGQIMGYVRKDGYRVVTINRQKFLNHRLVWAWHNGSCPAILDHINGIAGDDRIENLRLATPRQNSRYYWEGRRSLPLGVSFHKQCSRYQAQYHGRYLGLYDTPEQAHQAYLEAIS